VILGGEAALPERLLQWRDHAGATVRLLNTYGPTETSVVSVLCDLTERLRDGRCDRAPIGGPIAHTSARVLDAGGIPVPIGVAGELCIGGRGLARGYRNQPALTADRFVPDPFAEEPGERLYRTGDRVRWNEDGELEFLGRLDEQVKVRGFRVEPGEIAAELRRHDAVRDAVCLALPRETGELQLIAYYALAESASSAGSEALGQEIAADLRARLPDYMVPAAFVPIESLPVTPSGKVDRKALAALDWLPSASQVGAVAPRTELERAVAAVWSEVLGVESVGVEDSFFELGGHSLLAMQLVSRIDKKFEVRLPLVELFATPTVAGVARAIEEEKQGLRAPPITRVSRESTLALSFPQQRLWLLNQLLPGDPSYNIPIPIRIHGPLDRDALERTFQEIVQRHEVLRTTFAEEEGGAQQVVHPFQPVSVPFVDLGDQPEEEREGEVRRRLKREALRGFELREEAPIRVLLLKVRDDEHIVLMTVHHIAWDGWSMHVFLREIAAIYPALSAGMSSPLSELRIQYADFARWQRDWLQGGALERHMAYWQVQLSDAPVTMLPTDALRPSVRTFRGAIMTTRYPQEVVDALSILSRAEGATLFMTLLAAFQTLVSRYTREQDVVVGTPIAGRNTEQVEPLIGFFVNTLVLRNDLSGDPTFRELLGRVRETTLGAYTHQDMPFDLLAEKLVPVRDPSLNPFFQLLFSMQNNPVADVTASGELTFELLQPEYETAKFDLTLLVSESGEGLDVSWEYNTDLFEPETIQRLSDNYRVLLQGIARQPDARLSGLPLLADEQAHYLLEEWNRTTADSWSDRCVHSLIEAQVERTPEATAVVAGSEEVSFGELNERANRLAHYLRKRGVGASSLVGICLGRSVDLIVSVLAVLKSGAAYVPLDPAAPRARLANMLEDAAVECVITDGAAAACLSESPSPTVHLEDEAEAIAAEPAGNLGPLATPSHRMYAIFTSGSTGRPKLAAVYHRGFSNLLHWFISEFELDDAARILLVSSFSFDLTQKNLYTSLITGGRLVLHQSKIFDPEAIAADIEAHGITQINCTPSTFYPVIECADDEALAKLSPLKLVFLGGEPIILSRLERWLGSPTCAAQIVNTYGPTECTDICLFHRVEDPEALRGRKVPLGGPVPNVRLYILDDSQAPLPIGAVGELCIAGEGVGQGYVNDPELTTSRFLPDPFSTSSGERLYRTGDLVRHSGDGTLEYIGRADHQVKVRGFRIEYGEIEAALRKHGSVKEAVVLVQEEEENDSWLAAYIVPEESSGSGSAPGALEGAVRRYLRSELPDYLIPASFTVLESLPLSPNGKVDRAALPVPQRSRGGASSEYVAPRTDIEALLCGVLAELLNIERVGVHDNFFELGGDSVLAIQVVAKARGRGLRVNPIHMFEHPTVEELAEVAAIATEIDAEQGEVTGDVPLLPVQRHYFETNAVDPHFFNHPFLFEIREPLDEEALRLAVRELLQHHDALRLAFEETDAGWSQECAAFDEALVERVFTAFSLSDVAEDERAQQIEDACAQLQASFDMAGPLIRVARFDLGEGQTSRLFLVIHHLVVDAVSWRILMEDLFSAYQQALRGGLVALPPKTTSFRRWAQLIEEYASSEALQEEVPSWLTEPRIADRPLPVDLSGGINDVASMAVETERLTVEESDTLLRVAPVAFRAQMNHVLLTALARALMPWLKSRAVLVELEGHGREHIFEDVDLSRTVGWFTSRFPVHLEVTEDAIPDAIEGVKAQLEALPNRGFGYGLLRYTRRDDELRQQLVARVQPEIVFNYLGRIDQATMEDMPIALAPEPVGQAESPSRLRSPVFEIISSVAEGEFIVGWSYSKNLHRSETIQGLLRAFVEELRAIITESKAPAKREYKPEDFAQAKLTKDQLAKVIAKVQKKSGPSRGRKQ
jgi:amino acid adenylation domain-containing protein/non-ribosomal peptide synthase protein (TIGR01720 family)